MLCMGATQLIKPPSMTLQHVCMYVSCYQIYITLPPNVVIFQFGLSNSDNVIMVPNLVQNVIVVLYDTRTTHTHAKELDFL